MDADILIRNGKCISMDEGLVYDWLAIKDGKISALGYGEDFGSPAENCRETIDANGASVLPGFIDCHIHMVQAAIDALCVDLSGARNFGDIADLIREAAGHNPEDSIYAIGLDVHNLAEGRLPCRTDLDRFWSDSPVWINTFDYQISVLNTYGLLYYKIPFTSVGVECDEKRVPTGIFQRHANALLRGNILRFNNDFYRMEALRKFVPFLASKGLTTACAVEGGTLYCDRDAEFINEVIRHRSVYLDMELYFQTLDVARVLDMGLKRLGGCLYIDGTFNARSAALSFDYADMPGRRGILHFTQEKLNELIEQCYRQRIQTALYAIGDRAIEMALVAHEHAARLTGNLSLRHRLEHAELVTPDQMKRAAALNLIFCMQPTYETLWGGRGGMYEACLGENYRRTNPFRQILDAGVMICGGSDCDVSPADYLLAVGSAMNLPVPSHNVTLDEALAMFTTAGAYAIGQECSKGRLKKGYLADIVMLDGDIYATPKEKIKEMGVLRTIKSGRIVYENGIFRG